MIFSADGVSPDPKKIEAIANAPRPTNSLLHRGLHEVSSEGKMSAQGVMGRAK